MASTIARDVVSRRSVVGVSVVVMAASQEKT
jgi:hypothetical protein